MKNVKRNKERLIMAKVVESLICRLLKPCAVISVKKMDGYNSFEKSHKRKDII